MKIGNFVIPHFFYKQPIPLITNPDLKHAINWIRNQPTQEQAIERALDLLEQKYDSIRLLSIIELWKLYGSDPNELWDRKGFMHCTHQNFLLRVLLVESGKVRDANLSLGHSLVFHISPHQFLILHRGNEKIALDPWNYGLGAKIGQYASGFGMSQLS